MSQTAEEHLLPTGPTARILCVPAKFLKEEAAQGRIPHLRAGKSILFNVARVREVLLRRAAAEGMQSKRNDMATPGQEDKGGADQ